MGNCEEYLEQEQESYTMTSREIREKHMTAMSRKDREARRMNRAMTRNQDTEECMSSDLIHGGRNWCFFLESLVLSY